MKIFSVAMMSAAVVTGLAGAGVAYEIATAGQDGAAASVTDTSPVDDATAVDVVRPKKRWAPCVPPAALEGRECVTDVVRTVILPAPATRRGDISGLDDDGDDTARDDADDAFDDHGEDSDDREDHADSDDDDSEDHADSDDDSEDHADDDLDDSHDSDED